MPVVGSPRWSSAAVGGFGSASFTVPYAYYDEFVWLAKVSVYDGTDLLWEGRVEDRSLNIGTDEWTVDIKCFGFQRLLQENSVRRIWLMRSIPWRPSWKIGGAHSPGGGSLAAISGVTPTLRTDLMFCTVGQFDPVDLTRVGIFINNNTSASTSNGNANWAVYVAPQGIDVDRFIATATGALPLGGAAVWFAQDSVDATGTWNALIHGDTIGTAVNQACTSGARYLLLGVAAVGTSNFGIWEDIRILCTPLTEDTSGAMYGGSVLRDLLSLVPNMGVGDVDAGSEFGIQSIARPVRDSIVSVVGEIASYYTKEWGVWEGPSFHWTEEDNTTPHWVIELEDITGGSIDSSLQGTTKTIYIVYENAATGEPEEQDAVSTDIRNPYVKEGQSADEVLSAPVMLPNSGQKLADNLIVDHGGFPSVRGRITVPANRLVNNSSRGPTPACWMRGGDNVYIPGLPRDDWMNHGRDGQTLFHITAVDTDMKGNNTSIEFEGYTRRGDVLLARIAAVTRTLTG
jgi:hypothetical protein